MPFRFDFHSVCSFATVVGLGLGLAALDTPLSAQAGVARPGTALSVAQKHDIDALFTAYDKPHVPGCALGVFRDGAIAYGRGYGWADLERDVPITTSSLFDIGSTSKQFAAASIALLVAQGKVAYTDDVHKYIPELPAYGAPITIDNLMHHTSGMRDYTGLLELAGHTLEEATTDSQALARIVRQRNLNFPPARNSSTRIRDISCFRSLSSASPDNRSPTSHVRAFSFRSA